MYKYKFNIITDDINAHIKNSMTEEEREFFKDTKFIPCNVQVNEDMDIEVTAVAALEPEEVAEAEENQE